MARRRIHRGEHGEVDAVRADGAFLQWTDDLVVAASERERNSGGHVESLLVFSERPPDVRSEVRVSPRRPSHGTVNFIARASSDETISTSNRRASRLRSPCGFPRRHPSACDRAPATSLSIVGARDRIDLELELVGLREEGRVLQGFVEGLAQRLRAVVGHAGRRREGPAHDLPAEHELEDLLLSVVGEVADQRECAAAPAPSLPTCAPGN